MSYKRPEPLSKGHSAADFGCGRKALDEWLQRYALAAQSSGSATVRVTTQDGRDVVGYYAVAAAQVEAADATDRLLKGQPARRPIPAVLLARLAVDSRHQGRGLGASLLQDAMARCAVAAEEVGIRALLVHAKGVAARAWYVKHGFEVSPTDELHLVVLMKDVRKQLRELADTSDAAA